MNEITLESTTTKIIVNIPPINSLAAFWIEYKHNLRKPFPYLLKIELNAVLHLKDELNDKDFIITSVLRKYRIKVKDKLTVKDLSEVWYESGNYLVNSFHSFEKKQFNRKSEIGYSNALELEEIVAPLVHWFYDNRQN